MSGNVGSNAPTIWMNVTTSSQWSRSPVGIVRTEVELRKQLQSKLQHRFQAVVLEGGDFVPEAGAGAIAQSRGEYWPEPSYGTSTDPFDPLQSPPAGVAIEKKQVVRPKFKYGDILITVGLDWDHPGLHDKIRELRQQYGLTVITCCYDLIPILYPQYCVSDVAGWFKNYIISMTWLSDGILCISDATRRDYLEFADQIGLPDRRTEVIRLGSSLPPRDDDEEPSDDVAKVLKSPFFLFVSTIERRKNHEVLYRAYHLILQERPELKLPKLVFVGMQGWGVAELMSDIHLDPCIKDEIVILPHVSDNDLSLLYKKCDAVLFPSLYEGWGLPIAEALENGRPVIASDAGSIPEVGGNLVRYVDPWSPKDWAQELLRLIENGDETGEWAERISKEFKPYEWSAAADTVIALASELRDKQPTKMVLEPGYDMSSVNGTHYGAQIIYEGPTGIVCHGPYFGAPRGRHMISVNWTWIAGTSGYVRFIAAHAAGAVRAAVQRIEVEDLGSGAQVTELWLDLPNDVPDLELVCEAHSEDTLKFSVDAVSIRIHPQPSKVSRTADAVELVDQPA